VYGIPKLHKDNNIQALDLLYSSLKINADPAGGHTGGSTANLNISANSNFFSKQL
jgi:hypothetical protein